jgi:hypothetical protein
MIFENSQLLIRPNPLKKISLPPFLKIIEE